MIVMPEDKEFSTEEIAQQMINNLDIDEIFDLARKVTEKHFDKDDEMYKWFHDISNIGKGNTGDQNNEKVDHSRGSADK